MKWHEFEKLLFITNSNLIISTFIFIILILKLLFLKKTYAIFDPLNIMILNSSSVFTVLFTLYYLKEIDTNKLFQLLIINIIIILSFRFFLNTKVRRSRALYKVSVKKFDLFYKIHTCFFISTFFIYIFTVGLGAIYNKLTVFNNLGYLNYLQIVIFPGQLILILLKRWMYGIKSKKDTLFLMTILFMFMISGGKTAAVTFMLYFYSVSYYLYKNGISEIFLKYKKSESKYLLLAFCGVFFLFSLYNHGASLQKILQKIFFRIISTSDIYYMAYPKNLIDKLGGLNLREYFFNPLISPILRRFGYQNKVLGYEVIEKLYGITNPKFGPNTRADVILQINFSYFSIVISIFIGYVLAKLRTFKSKHFFKLYLVISLMVSSESIITDFSLFAMKLFAIVFFIVPIYLFVNILYKKEKS